MILTWNWINHTSPSKWVELGSPLTACSVFGDLTCSVLTVNNLHLFNRQMHVYLCNWWPYILDCQISYFLEIKLSSLLLLSLLYITKKKTKKKKKTQWMLQITLSQAEAAANPRYQEEEKKWPRLTCAKLINKCTIRTIAPPSSSKVIKSLKRQQGSPKCRNCNRNPSIAFIMNTHPKLQHKLGI